MNTRTAVLDPDAADARASDAAATAEREAAEARRIRIEVEARRREQMRAQMRVELESIDVAELDRAAVETEREIVRAVEDAGDVIAAWLTHLTARQRAVTVGGLLRGYAETLGVDVPPARVARGVSIGGGALRADGAGLDNSGPSVTVLFNAVAAGVVGKAESEAQAIRARVKAAADAGLPACQADNRTEQEKARDAYAERKRRAAERDANLREQRYALHCERQQRAGLEPVPFDRFTRDGGILLDGMSADELRRCGLDD